MKKPLTIALGALLAGWLLRRSQSARDERDLWAEATDEI